MTMIRRLCVFVIYDPEGIVDDYILYYLNELKQNAARLTVVCNGEMRQESIERLDEYADDVFIRENKGFDGGAFKDVLCNLLGWDVVRGYDELALVNDSCFGQLYPLRVVFEEMAGRECDYWGITYEEEHAYVKEVFQWHNPGHIQAYFWVVRKEMLASDDFKRFWEELRDLKVFSDAIWFYEFRIVEYFQALGYKESAYVEKDALLAPTERYVLSLLFESYRLIAERKFPLIKKKAFAYTELTAANEIVRCNMGEDARRALDYVSTYTDYPVRLIWSNLLRQNDVNVLRNNLRLDYILSTRPRHMGKAKPKCKVAIVACIKYCELLGLCLSYLDQVSYDIDLHLATSDSRMAGEIKEHFRLSGRSNCKILAMEHIISHTGAILSVCQQIHTQYDYLCCVHDLKSDESMPYMTIGQSYMDLLWETTLKNSDYIENVLSCFAENEMLGFLAPPYPYMSCFLTERSRTWPVDYEATHGLAKRLGLKCKMSPKKVPFAYGMSFWARSAALKTLFEHSFDHDDLTGEASPGGSSLSQAVKWIFPYVAQHEGYYSAGLMTDEYASLYTVNLQNMLDTIISSGFTRTPIVEFMDVIPADFDDLQKFCQRFKRVYIYGKGRYASHCYEMLNGKIEHFLGFIVSDGRKTKENEEDGDVHELSEVEPRNDEGIIVALNRQFSGEVLPELRGRGFANVIGFLK